MNGEDGDAGWKIKLFVFLSIDLRGRVLRCGTSNLSKAESDPI